MDRFNMKEKDMTHHEHQHLATLVYDIGLKKQIEERVEAKYSKRIEYLVNANNELMYELEQCELECYGRGYEGTTNAR